MDNAIQIEQASLDRTVEAVRRLVLETGRTIDDALSYAAVKIAASGRARAKPGARRHEVVKNPKWWEIRERMVQLGTIGRGDGEQEIVKQARQMKRAAKLELDTMKANAQWPYQIVKLQQGGRPPVLLPAVSKNPTSDYDRERMTIEKRGLAHKIWDIMHAKLAALKGHPGGASDGNLWKVRHYVAQFGPSRIGHGIQMQSRLSYMDTAYPGITLTALENGSKALVHELDGRIKRAAERANKKAA
jgi:hypothetical protein